MDNGPGKCYHFENFQVHVKFGEKTPLTVQIEAWESEKVEDNVETDSDEDLELFEFFFFFQLSELAKQILTSAVGFCLNRWALLSTTTP